MGVFQLLQELGGEFASKTPHLLFDYSKVEETQLAGNSDGSEQNSSGGVDKMSSVASNARKECTNDNASENNSMFEAEAEIHSRS